MKGYNFSMQNCTKNYFCTFSAFFAIELTYRVPNHKPGLNNE